MSRASGRSASPPVSGPSVTQDLKPPSVWFIGSAPTVLTGRTVVQGTVWPVWIGSLCGRASVDGDLQRAGAAAAKAAAGGRRHGCRLPRVETGCRVPRPSGCDGVFPQHVAGNRRPPAHTLMTKNKTAPQTLFPRGGLSKLVEAAGVEPEVSSFWHKQFRDRTRTNPSEIHTSQ